MRGEAECVSNLAIFEKNTEVDILGENGVHGNAVQPSELEDGC
jgi:hypothetical protein